MGYEVLTLYSKNIASLMIQSIPDSFNLIFIPLIFDTIDGKNIPYHIQYL